MGVRSGRGHGRIIQRGRGLALIPLVAAWSLQATPSAPVFRFAIAPGPLRAALASYGATTGDQLLYPDALVAEQHSGGIDGTLSADLALAKLLSGTGIVARRVKTGVIVLGRAHRAPAKAANVVDPAMAASVEVADRTPTAIVATSEAVIAEAGIVVTGSHIRGRDPGTPPVTSIGRRDLDRNGYATVAQALQALPGNFGGVATEQTTLAFSDQTGANGGLSTGVNLRGLGAGATLVLLNGQRLGGSGLNGDFSDVSSIPTGALDRVEVLLDGASAIYGSDAVGGVVNILLKRRFDGVETRLRGASVTTGSKRDVQFDQTIGRDWGSGGMILSYEFNRTGRLASDARDYARSADSRAFGGTDHRYYFSLPGNVLGIDDAGAFGPIYAIPPGQDGTALTPGDFQRGKVNLENFRRDTDLIPRQTRHSAYASLSQEIAPDLQAGFTALYSHRAFDARSLGGISVLSVTDANPFFVSPEGATSDLIAYSLGEELGPSRVHGFAEAMAYSGDAQLGLGGGWRLRATVNYAQQRERNTTDNLGNDAAIAEALGSVPDNPATSFNTATDGYFNPYGSGTSNTRRVLDFISSGYLTSRTRSSVLSGHVDADGTLLRLPGGPVQVAVGGDVRRERFHLATTNRFASIDPVPGQAVLGARTVLAGFAELRVPLVSEAMAVPGVRRLELSTAARIERYPRFGTTTNPKVGASWTPVEGVGLRSSYGTSFRAPNLTELNAPARVSTVPLATADGTTVPVIQLTGGNPDLKPETATSWTAGVDLAPRAVPGLTANVTWFHTTFRRRVGTPASENFPNALIDPSIAPFVRLVSPATSAADLAEINALLDGGALAGSNIFPPTSIGAIVDARYVNTGRLTVSGIDVTVQYSLPVGRNRFDVGLNASYLLRYREQTTPTAPAVSRRNLVGEPVDLRGRATLGWTRGVLNALIGVNYVAAYHDLTGNRVHAWTACDLQVGLTPDKASGWKKGLSLSLVAQNLFDRDPPFYDSPSGAGYDAANADALGRLVSLQLTKSW